MASWNLLKPWASYRLLPKGMWILQLTAFTNRMGHMAFPFLVLFLTKERNFSPSEAGSILLIYGIASIFAAWISGILTDRLGPALMMKISFPGTAVVVATFPYLQTFYQIAFATCLWAIFSDSFRPAIMSHLARVTTSETKKIAYSFQRLAVNLGMSVGPMLGGFLAELSFQLIFTVEAILTIFSWGILLIYFRQQKAAEKLLEVKAESNTTLGPGRVLADKQFLVLLLGTALVYMVYFQTESTLSIFLIDHLKLAPRFFGFVFTINTLMIVFFEIPLNIWTLKWPYRISIAAGACCYAIGVGLLAFATDFTLVAIATIILTIGEMMESPALTAAVSEIAPRKRLGEYMGAVTMSWGAAYALGPWLGTVAIQNYGGVFLWKACFVVALLGALLLYVGCNRTAFKNH